LDAIRVSSIRQKTTSTEWSNNTYKGSSQTTSIHHSHTDQRTFFSAAFAMLGPWKRFPRGKTIRSSYQVLSPQKKKIPSRNFSDKDAKLVNKSKEEKHLKNFLGQFLDDFFLTDNKHSPSLTFPDACYYFENKSEKPFSYFSEAQCSLISPYP